MDDLNFRSLVPLAYCKFRPPHRGDRVMAPLGSFMEGWEVGTVQTLKEATGPSYNASSIGSVTLRMRRQESQYSDAKAYQDVRHCVAATDIARPLDAATPLHAALALRREDVALGFLKHAGVKCSGLLPLHIALEVKAKPDTILQILFQHVDAASCAYPDAQKRLGSFPLHAALYMDHSFLVVNAVLQAYPRAASLVDGRGALPVHIALKLGAPDAVVVALLRAFPDAAKMPYYEGLSFPGHDVHCNKDADVVLSAPSLLLATLMLRQGYGNLRCAGKLGRRVARLLEQRCAVISALAANPAAAAAACTYKQLRPLHWVAFMGAPVTVVRALAKVPGSHVHDGHNHLPFHVALFRQAPANVLNAIKPPANMKIAAKPPTTFKKQPASSSSK